MEAIKDKLDKIKKILGNKEDSLQSPTSEQLSDWAKIQLSIGQDIKEVLSSIGDNIQEKDRAHRIKPLFHQYLPSSKLIQKQIHEYGKVKDELLENISKNRDELIDTIDSFYEIHNYGVQSIMDQLCPIIEELEATNIDKDDVNALEILKAQREIQIAINEIHRNGEHPDNMQYRDRRHRLGNIMYVYFSYCSFVVRCIEERSPLDEKIMEAFTMIDKKKLELIEILKSLNNIVVDLKEKTLVGSAISYIKTKFQDCEVAIEDNTYILCSSRVYKSIIDELKENYRKYGRNGHISMTREDNMLIISLKNQKKEKDEHDFSSQTGLKIFEEHMNELGGTFDADYTTDDCTTTIRLPIYLKE